MRYVLLVPAVLYGCCYVLTSVKLVLFYYHCRVNAPTSAPRIRDLLRLLLVESNITAAVFLLRLLPPRKRRVVGGGAAGTGPCVVLCHGYLMDGSCFRLLEGRLRRAGAGSVWRISLPSLFESIPSLARSFAEDLRGIQRAHPGGDMVIVAHSMGGIVARTALADPDLASKVSRLVTMGSPHHGAFSARFVLGANARDMRPGSRFLEELNSMPLPVPIVCMTSRQDNVVYPKDTACVRGATEIEFEGIGHMGFLTSRCVAEELARIVASASRPAQADVA